jgi:predicted ribosome quality control (RQC) complex YloA/Tae2 family protein
MNFDVFTIAALVDELNASLSDGKVQDTLELGNDAIGLEVYSFTDHRRRYLMLSADPTQARVQVLEDKLRRGVETPTPLGLMLRRDIEEARLTAIRQPDYERVIMFDLKGAAGEFTLICEPMERRANILLVRGGMILDCLRRVGPQDNRVRLSLPGHEYIPPPAQINKHRPDDLTLELIQNMLRADATKHGWRALTDTFLGYSPLLAKETIYRAAGRLDAKCAAIDAADLYAVMREMLEALLNHRWEAGVVRDENEQIVAYAVYEITHLRGWEQVASINTALGLYYGAPGGIEAYDAAKKPIFEILDEAQQKVQRKLDALKRSETDDTERERLRQSGELILAYQYQIKPGDTSLDAEYDFDQPPLHIALDPKLSALDNAKKYFADYDHAKRAMAEVPQRIAETQQELNYLAQLHSDLTLAANWPEIGEVQDALQAGGYWSGPKTARPKHTKTGALRVVTPEGIIIWVGRNSRQNEDVTFTKGRPEDLWLHARGVPGAHVIVKTNGRSVAPGVIQKAASLAAYYSNAQHDKRALVDVTERRHVHKIKGGKPGMVTYRNETVMEATPEKE